MNQRDKQFMELVDKANIILIIIPDRPDADSLASALLLDNILYKLNKKPFVYCGVNIPDYIKYIKGWDRVNDYLPSSADLSIIVDNSSLALLEKFDNSAESINFKTKPFIIIDHHDGVETDIPYASLNLSRQNNASAGELIYEIAKEQKIDLDIDDKNLVAQSILADTLGLASPLATSKSYRIIADLIDEGVNRAELEEQRREYGKLEEQVFRYKGKLIERTQLYFDNQLALCLITEDEAYDVGTLYNPGPLILGELLLIKNIKIAIAIKTYSGRATAAIRTTSDSPFAGKIASKFGGGGHDYSAGFKISNWDGDISKLISDITTIASELVQ